MILHTTKKLADKLKKQFEISPKPLVLPNNHNSLGEWHANLITIQRRNCLLFIHNQTRFSVIIPGVKAADLKQLEPLFYEGLVNTMFALGYQEEVVKAAAERMTSLQIDSKTDRSVLASLNQIGQSLEHHAWHDGIDAILASPWERSARLCDRPCNIKGMKGMDCLWPAKEMQNFLGFEPQKTRIDKQLHQMLDSINEKEQLEEQIKNSPNVIPLKRR